MLVYVTHIYSIVCCFSYCSNHRCIISWFKYFLLYIRWQLHTILGSTRLYCWPCTQWKMCQRYPFWL